MTFSYILAFIFVISTAAMAFASPESANAAMDGAQAAVSFTLSITGGICLWSGVMELMERCGITAVLGRLLHPLLRCLFPESTADASVLSALTENVSANLLGLGNAATPAGIRAAQGIAARTGCGHASDELCMLVVLNTASIQLLPATVASVRAACGATAPFDIVPAVWISSAVSVAAGLLTAAALKRLWP